MKSVKWGQSKLHLTIQQIMIQKIKESIAVISSKWIECAMIFRQARSRERKEETPPQWRNSTRTSPSTFQAPLLCNLPSDSLQAPSCAVARSLLSRNAHYCVILTKQNGNCLCSTTATGCVAECQTKIVFPFLTCRRGVSKMGPSMRSVLGTAKPERSIVQNGHIFTMQWNVAQATKDKARRRHVANMKNEECGEHYNHIQQVECFRPTRSEEHAKRSKQKREDKRQGAAAFREHHGLLVHIKKCFKNYLHVVLSSSST